MEIKFVGINSDNLGTIYEYELTLIPAGISDHMPSRGVTLLIHSQALTMQRLSRLCLDNYLL